jgi:hypothetical protein
MKFVTRPPSDANGVGHRGDDLDGALFAFFRSEMPRPWPQLKLPDDAPAARPPVRPAEATPAPSPRSWFRSPRFALAASVALLIGGYAVMSAALTPPAPENPSLKGSSASPKSVMEDMRIEDPPEDDVDLHGWLEQDGNKPTTIHIELHKHK